MMKSVGLTVKELFQQAEEQLRQGELEGALESARRLLAKDDTSFQNWMLEGSIRVALGEWQPAERAYRRACIEAPHSPVPRIECAKLSMALGQTGDAFEFAIEAYAISVQMEDRRDALHIQAESLLSSIETTLASRMTEETALSLHSDPLLSTSSFLTAPPEEGVVEAPGETALEEPGMQEELSKGLQLVEKAIDLDSDVAELWELKAHFLTLSEKYEDAIISRKKALELDPEDATCWHLLGTTFLQLENEEEAKAAFKKVHELDHKEKNDSLTFLASDFERWAKMAWSDIEEHWNETLHVDLPIHVQTVLYPDIHLLESDDSVFDPRSPLYVDFVQQGDRDSIRLLVFQANVEREAMTTDPEECYRVLYQLLEETMHLFLDALTEED